MYSEVGWRITSICVRVKDCEVTEVENGKYNLLTLRLLSEGYTADNHPNYVEVGRTCQDKDNPLHNLDGGFEYYRWYVYEKAFRTPCGLMCKGTSCMTSLAINGAEFSFENDMATVHCPYNKCNCTLKDKRLLNPDSAIKDWCNVHMTDEKYQYEGSLEAELKLWDDQIRREKISFNLQHNGRTCENHMHYDRDKQEWVMNYNPCYCGKSGCNGYWGQKYVDGKLICPILGRPLDKAKGNVYYDIKKTYRRYDLDGTLFEGQIDTEIEKGIRYFEKPVSMDICRNVVKLCQDEIRWKVENEWHSELFFAEYYGRHFEIEILNIRAQEKESRDLMQDLQDIRDGVKVYHASDAEKADKKYKSEKRQKAKEKKIAALEKRILEIGYGNMEEYEQNKVCKYLDFDRIDELEAIREEKIKEKREEPVQLSLFG